MTPHENTADREDTGRGWFPMLGLILTAAAAIRLAALGSAPLWWDECHTVRVAERLAGTDPGRVAAGVARGLSTYFLALVSWVDRTTPEGLVRLPSAMAGVVLVLALAWLGREIGSRRLGIVLGALGVMSPFLVWHAREARWYSFTFQFIVLGAVAFVRALRAGGIGPILGVGAAGLLAASTYAPAIVILVVEAAWLAAVRVRVGRPVAMPGVGSRRATIAGAVAGIALAAAATAWLWMTIVSPALSGGARGYGFHNLGGPRLFTVAYTPVAFATGYSIGPGPLEWHTTDPEDVAIGDLLLLLIGVAALGGLVVAGYRALASAGSGRMAMAILSLAVAPPVAIIAACLWTDHAYAPRHAGIALPFVLVLAAAGIVSGRPRSLAIGLAATLGLLQGWSLWNLHLDPRYRREDVRAAARHVEGSAGPDDPILIIGGIKLPWEHYYRGRATWQVVHPTGPDPWSPERLQSRLDGLDAVWVVAGRLWDEPGADDLLAVVGRWGQADPLVALAGGVVVGQYRARPPGGTAAVRGP